jgi:signal peptidase I
MIPRVRMPTHMSSLDSNSPIVPGESGAPKTGVTETLMSLIMSFVLAMTARGFIIEGFVIPTGSMAPTLMGQHVQWTSPQTGWEYAIDANGYLGRWQLAAQELSKLNGRLAAIKDPAQRKQVRNRDLKRALIARWDPMFGLSGPVERSTPEPTQPRPSNGDRVIVLKSLYPFTSPERFNVVVFKNPTDPVGPTQNFIKRLVGLPEEQLTIVDGDVFTGPLGASAEALRVVRKPEFVQRAVWQPVYNSSLVPTDLTRWEESSQTSWWGAPFMPDSANWEIGTDRTWRTTTNESASLTWNHAEWPITDFNMYNVNRLPNASATPFSRNPFPISDIRIAGVIDPIDEVEFFGSRLVVTTRGVLFEWSVKQGEIELRMSRESDGSVIASSTAPCDMTGSSFEIDCWQVDQKMWMFINGDLRLELPFNEWSPEERFQASYPNTSVEDYLTNPTLSRPEGPRIDWHFDGGVNAIRNVRVDHDLYYRPTMLDSANQRSQNGPFIRGLGFGSDFRKPGRLESEQFLMFGDNSAASRDGRIWGRPHPLSAQYTGDDAPFVVPRNMLIGKAFSVYWPAPLSFPGTDSRWVPNFGKLRFIR